MTAVSGAWATEKSINDIAVDDIIKLGDVITNTDYIQISYDGHIIALGNWSDASGTVTVTRGSIVNDNCVENAAGEYFLFNDSQTGLQGWYSIGKTLYGIPYNESGLKVTDKTWDSDWEFYTLTVELAPASAEPSEPEAPAVTPTGNKNEWTFTMPDYAVVANVEYETELELQEENVNTTVLADWDGYEADITLQRKLIAGSWNTLAVPFNVSSQMLYYLTSTYGMSVKQLASTSLENDGKTLMLNFENATEMVAGTSYLVKVTTDYDFSARALPNVEVNKELNPVETTYADFIPTLGKTLVTGPDGDKDNKDAVLFVAAGNTLKNPTVVNDPEQQSSYLKGFRAYFQLKNVPAEARSFALYLGDEATGIKAIDNGQLTIDNDRYYDLQGRKVNAAQKGVYIMNGKKVIK